MAACFGSVLTSLLFLLSQGTLDHGDVDCTVLPNACPTSGLQLLQVKAKPMRSKTVNDWSTGVRSPTDAEWDSTKTALLQLQEVAENHTAVLTGVMNASAKEAPVEIVAMLSLLEGLYNDSKTQIAELTSRDTKSKQHFVEQEATHKTRIEAIEARVKKDNLTNESYTDLTAQEVRMWNYWQRVREREHSQYLRFLKLKHGMMHKMTAMIGLYKEVIAGHIDAAQAKDGAVRAAGGNPFVVLLQNSDAPTALAHFCREALIDLHAVRHEMTAQ